MMSILPLELIYSDNIDAKIEKVANLFIKVEADRRDFLALAYFAGGSRIFSRGGIFKKKFKILSTFFRLTKFISRALPKH